MKRFFSLVLCSLLAISMLVSCGDEGIGKVPDHYPENNNTIDDLKVNMYMIVEGDTATGNAFDTVKRMVAQYTLTTYHTEVNLIYCTAAEYEDIVMEAVDNTGSQFSKDTPEKPMCPVHIDDVEDEDELCDKCGAEYNTDTTCTAQVCTDSNKDGVCDNCKYVSDNKDAHIVLVNSYDLMNNLVSTGKLADLSEYLATDEFGTLNVKIPQPLLSASMYDDMLYSIPNNHLLGEYQYLVINEEIAKHTLKESASKLESYTTYESTEQLRAEMAMAGYDPTQYVYVQNGTYSLKAELEANGNVCNVITAPVVDKDEAFSSAFAILDTSETLNYRSMQIVYALNNDAELRNLLQYGVRGTNYSLSDDGEVIMVSDPDNAYRMKLEYTGNIFIAAYCDEIGWTAEAAQNASKQNEEATLKN